MPSVLSQQSSGLAYEAPSAPHTREGRPRRCSAAGRRRPCLPCHTLHVRVCRQRAEEVRGDVRALHLHHRAHDLPGLVAQLHQRLVGRGGQLGLHHAEAGEVLRGDGLLHVLHQDRVDLLHNVVGRAGQQFEGVLDEAAVSHFGRDDVRLVAIGGLDRLADLADMQEAVEGQVVDHGPQLGVERGEQLLTPALLVDLVAEGLLKLAAHLERHVHHASPGLRQRLSHARDLLLELLGLRVHQVGDHGHLLLDHRQEMVAQRLGQEGRAHAEGDVLVLGVGFEVLLLLATCRDHVHVPVEILLRAVDDAHEREARLVGVAHEDLPGVGALVHQVKLGEHAEGSLPRGVHLLGEAQAVAVGQVRIGRRHRQHDAVGLADVLLHHILDLVHDGLRLPLGGDLGQARQVHQRQVHHVRRIDGQVDGHRRHIAALAHGAVRLCLDLLAHVLEVAQLAPLEVAELAVLVVALHQVEHQRTARTNARVTRQEVLAHHRFEHRRLARRLPAHHRDLRQGVVQRGQRVVAALHAEVAQL
eukprot:scaffold1023_cov292-Prasinococcus_capsulatus_cf.AAC.1